MADSVWDQLGNRTADDLIRALRKDGWEEELRPGATRAFRKGSARRIVIHYHPGKTYGVKLLKELVKQTGWKPEDMKRLKLIK